MNPESAYIRVHSLDHQQPPQRTLLHEIFARGGHDKEHCCAADRPTDRRSDCCLPCPFTSVALATIVRIGVAAAAAAEQQKNSLRANSKASLPSAVVWRRRATTRKEGTLSQQHQKPTSFLLNYGQRTKAGQSVKTGGSSSVSRCLPLPSAPFPSPARAPSLNEEVLVAGLVTVGLWIAAIGPKPLVWMPKIASHLRVKYLKTIHHAASPRSFTLDVAYISCWKNGRRKVPCLPFYSS